MDNRQLLIDCISFEPIRDIIFEEASRDPMRKLIVKGILQRAGIKNQNGRVYGKDILMREAKKYEENFVKERRAIGECVPAGTEIFTKDGWENIENISVGDEVFTLNISNDQLEIQEVTDTVEKLYNDQMVHIYNSKNLDIMVTKKHKVVLWDRYDKPYVITAEELYEKIKNNDSGVSHSYIRNSGNWIGEDNEYFTLPNTEIKIKTDDWAAFLGIYLAEGHCAGTKGGRKSNLVGITQVKEDTKAMIEELLKRLPFKYVLRNNRQFIIVNEFLHNHLFDLGNSYTKKIPEYAKQWSVRLLNILLKWMLLGDGKNRMVCGKVIREYCTISPQLSEDTFEIMLKLGSGATTSIRTPEDRIFADRLILAENTKPLHIIHEKTTKGIYLDCRFLYAELVDFNDYVYCVTIPNSTWLMRYNGKITWTHNCDHPESSVVNLQNVSHNVVEMHWEGDDLIGSIEILPTPNGNILRELFRANIRLGISSRGLGTIKKSIHEDADFVQDDFELIAFDFVSNPSTRGAFMFPAGNLSEGVKTSINPPIFDKWMKIESIIRDILSEIK